MIELTNEQRQQLESGKAIDITDSQTARLYVIVQKDIYERTHDVLGVEPAQNGTGNAANPEVEKRFAALASEWKEKRGHSSSIIKLCAHPAYQQIIGMGEKAIPLLLRELEREPDHWFWALKVITGVNPVPQESRANLGEMAHHWVKWGREQGYRW